MFGTLFSALKTKSDSAPAISRRRYSRRHQDHCVCIIDSTIYPVEDWSMGGLRLHVDGRQFGLGDVVDVNIKFKTSDNVIDVNHRAHIVRKTERSMSLEFEPINGKIRNAFQTVIDDYVSSRFNAG